MALQIDLPIEEMKQAVIEQAAYQLVEELSDGVKDRLLKEAIDKTLRRVDKIIDDELSIAINEALEEPTIRVDNWGDEIGSAQTLRERIKDHAMKFMNQKVDSSGKPTGYNGKSRYAWIAAKAARDVMDYEMRNEMIAATAEVKEIVKKKIAIIATEVISGLK